MFAKILFTWLERLILTARMDRKKLYIFLKLFRKNIFLQSKKNKETMLPQFLHDINLSAESTTIGTFYCPVFYNQWA